MSRADWYAEIAMRRLGMEGVGLAGDALRRALTTAFEAGQAAPESDDLPQARSTP